MDQVVHLPAEFAVDPGAADYKLRQIFCTPGGHWSVYILCDDGKWRKFDDSCVAEIPEEQM
ncbi:MAG: ubiquitin carboxyl-terminal hydrolase [Puniceicoccales bacterium]|nr:ubiquitin carboxyl-terminal hydrolase [Puniceicoccales bacterium]